MVETIGLFDVGLHFVKQRNGVFEFNWLLSSRWRQHGCFSECLISMVISRWRQQKFWLQKPKVLVIETSFGCRNFSIAEIYYGGFYYGGF